eukprot:1592993-Pyramimonas_sp.AAC.1
MGWASGRALGRTDSGDDGEALRVTEESAPPREMQESWSGPVGVGERCDHDVWGQAGGHTDQTSPISSRPIGLAHARFVPAEEGIPSNGLWGRR